MNNAESNDIKELTEAVRDLTFVTLLVHGKLDSKAETIRQLDKFGLTTGRIAGMMGMQSKDVSSSLNKSHNSKKEEHKHE